MPKKANELIVYNAATRAAIWCRKNHEPVTLKRILDALSYSLELSEEEENDEIESTRASIIADAVRANPALTLSENTVKKCLDSLVLECVLLCDSKIGFPSVYACDHSEATRYFVSMHIEKNYFRWRRKQMKAGVITKRSDGKFYFGEKIFTGERIFLLRAMMGDIENEYPDERVDYELLREFMDQPIDESDLIKGYKFSESRKLKKS